MGYLYLVKVKKIKQRNIKKEFADSRVNQLWENIKLHIYSHIQNSRNIIKYKWTNDYIDDTTENSQIMQNLSQFFTGLIQPNTNSDITYTFDIPLYDSSLNRL